MGGRGRGMGMRRGQRGGGPRGGARKRGGLPPAVRQKLREARERFDAGEFAQAVQVIDALAERAAGAGRHRMALHLGVLAVSAAARGGDVEGAVARVRTAASRAAAIQNKSKVARRFARMVHLLRQAGHEAEADAVEAAVLDALSLSRLPAPAEGRAVNRARRRMLPRACPACGAPVDPQAVEFDEDGADCPACGSELTR